jgi:hypothetical protein
MVKVNHTVDRDGCHDELLRSEQGMLVASSDSFSQHSGFKRSEKLQSVLFRMRELTETDVELDGRNPSPLDPRSSTDAYHPLRIHAHPDQKLERREGSSNTENLAAVESRHGTNEVQTLDRIGFTRPDHRDQQLTFEANEASIPKSSNDFRPTRLADASAVAEVPREELIRLRIQEAVRNQIYFTSASNTSKFSSKDEMSSFHERNLEARPTRIHPVKRKPAISQPTKQPEGIRQARANPDTRGTQNLTPIKIARRPAEREHTQVALNMDRGTYHNKRETSLSRAETTESGNLLSSQATRKLNTALLSSAAEDGSTGTRTDVSMDESSASSSGGGSTGSSSSEVSSISAMKSQRFDGDQTAARRRKQVAVHADRRGT